LLTARLQFCKLIHLLIENCLIRQTSSAFSAVAVKAGRDEVENVVRSSFGDGLYVVTLQDDFRRLLAAILASKGVPLEDLKPKFF
jgi:hypothetical protein